MSMAMKQKMGEKTIIYNTDSLNDGIVKLKYQEHISKDLQEPKSMTTYIEDCWGKIKFSVIKNTGEITGFRPKQERKPGSTKNAKGK